MALFAVVRPPAKRICSVIVLSRAVDNPEVDAREPLCLPCLPPRKLLRLYELLEVVVVGNHLELVLGALDIVPKVFTRLYDR